MLSDFLIEHIKSIIVYCCRGGIVEPEATVSVQFKHKDLVKTMRRIDPLYSELKSKLEEETLSQEETRKCLTELRNREAYLKPAYHVVRI